MGVPKLNSPIFGPTEHPFAIRCECNTQNEVLQLVRTFPFFRCDRKSNIITYLVAFKGLQALCASRRRACHHWSIIGQFPHLNRLIKASANKRTSVGCKCNRVNAILVTINPVESLNQESISSIPDSHAFVERPSCDIFPTRRDGHGCDAILDTEIEYFLSAFNIPQTDCSVATAGCNVFTVASKIKRVNVLLMSGECVSDSARCNIPNL